MDTILPKITRLCSLVLLLLCFSSFSEALGQATVTTDKDDYAPGEYVIITGTGWEPGEKVEFHFEETPKPETCSNSHDNFAIADGNGNIYYAGFLIKENHIGVHFVLTATGLTSERTAVTEFTDGNVRFSTTGLPNGTSVIVTYSYTKGQNTTNGSVTINSPGPTNAFAEQSATVTYSYPNSIIVGNTTYTLTTSSPGNGFSSGGNSALIDVIGNYSLSCTGPIISSAPSAQTITFGDPDPTFSVSATGTGLSYQWQYNTPAAPGTWVNVGANSNSYTVPSPDVSFSGRTYRVVITGTCGSVTSTPVALTVNKKNITGSFTAENKVYDGNTSATVLTRTLNGVLAADAGNVSLNGGTATFATPGVANGKTVTLTGSTLSGSAAGNYNLTSVGTTTANITALNITGNFTADNKIYDGNTSATVLTRSLNGVLAGDVGNVSLSGGTATFGDKNVANGKTVTLTGATLSGSAAGNYNLTSVGTTTANITALNITGNFTADNKVYDGTTSATVLGRSLNGVLAGDVGNVSLSGGTATFGDKNVANGKTVTLTGAILSGSSVGNYNLTSVGTTTANITPKSASVTADAQSKTYGDVDPTLTGTLSGFLAGDNVQASYSRTTGESVAGSPYTISATLSPVGVLGNYDITNNTGEFSITARAIEVTADDKSKVYGDSDPSLTYQITDGSLAFSDAFTGALTRDSGEDVGNYAITQGTLALSSNYALTFVDGNLEITARAIEVTADDKSKVYGDSDPSLTYQITDGSLAFSDAFTGALTRDSGEDVGNYAITQGTLALSSNYALTFVDGNLEITARAIEVTADDKSKVYGDSDPSLTYQITDGSLAFSDAFTGALTRDSGEDVGNYAITQGTLALSSNYALTFVDGNLEITARAIEVTADDKSKVYGDSDPSLTYQITDGSLAFSDAFTGALTRDSGEDVGNYAITQGTLALSSNYALTFVDGNLEITARAIEVTADDKSKVYGDSDPSLTYQITDGSLAFSDAFTGALTRDSGEDVGNYAITQGTLALSSNYALTFVDGNLEITARAIEVTADDKSKVYGDSDPSLTYQITDGSLAFSDAFTGALTRDSGEDVGNYAITQGTLALSSNYALTFVDGNLEITARAIEVTADDKSKVYGDSDPSLTYQITDGSLAFSDAFTGALTRDSGEDVGNYAITQGTLALSSNYALTFVDGNLEITARAIEVTADDKSKVYGDSDPSLTYQITDGSLAFSDAFTGALTRDSGEDVGNYAITQGTLALSSNYALTFVDGNLEITARAIEVTADDKSKVYGDSDPSLTYQITDGSLAFSDAFTGALTRDSGEDVGNYAITQGTLALSSNYALTFVDGNLEITARAIEVTADDKSKVYGDSDPSLTYQITDGSLAFSDAFTGALTRDSGEDVGNYAITQGTLALSSNYALTFVDGNLEITARAIEVTADDKSKVYGDSDPSLTYQITDGSLAFSDAFTGALTRDSGEDVGNYAITQGTLALSSNYALTFVDGNLEITARAIEVTADDKSKVYGDSDPSLTYQITDGSLAFSDAFTGALTRDSGEDVGNYAITQGTLALSSNYALTFVDGNLEITARAIEVTADDKSKVYGDSDPSLTYQITDGSLAFSDAFTGALTRDSGEDVGNYAITQGTLALSSNYALTFVDGNLEITARAIEVTADDKSKVYGDSDPSLTYQITDGSLAFSDAFTGALTRDSGEDVGNYAITQGTLALSSNYALTFVDGNLEITARAIEVTADDKSKVYGDSDPSLTYQITDGSLAFSDAFTGALTRDSGEDVGNYAITQGTLALSSNYALTFVDGNLEITARAIEVTADDKSKVYGDSDPSLTYQITDGSLAFSDAFTGALTRDSGEDVGNYAITQGTLALSSNYALTFVDGNLEITARAIEVTADDKSKVYGDSDPSLTYQITDGSLAFSDAFTGALTRDSGEDVGNYAITQGTLALSSNYALTFVDGNLEITARAIEVTADDKSKVYGDSDPSLTYQITDGSLAFSDAFTGALTRDSGEDVGNYAITQGTLALSSNYALTFVDGNLEITARAIEVTADDKSKVYGDSDPSLTYQITDGSLAFSDAFTGALTRDSGEDVGNYAITQGTLALSSNYALTFVDGNLEITARAIEVTADDKSKVYGDSDPSLTYQITDGSLAFSDAFTGALTRDSGEDVGNYAITQGTLALSSNYALTFVDGNLEITARAIEVTADDKSKVYGDSDPSLTYQITDGSLAFSDAFTGALTRDSGEDVGNYAITQGTLALSSNYALTFVDGNLEITARAIEVTADDKSKVYGDSDPSLTYQITDGSLAFSDAFTGALTRDSGEDVGNYAITQGTLALSSNYALTFVDGNLEITARAIEVTADDKSKVYGDSDPSLTYQITDGSLAFSDAFTGALTRDSGEDVGNYAITQGTLALSSNYALTFVDGNLEITARAIEVTADDKSKVYGDSDPSLTYQITDGSLAFSDAFTGALTRDSGEDVGNYAITQGTLALSSNYALTFVDGNLEITARAIEVTADDKSKVYGDSDPSLTYQITDGSLAFSDAFTGALTRDSGEDVGNYAITQGTLALSSNYALTFVDGNLEITARAIEVTADDKSKVYGDSDPSLTYQITDGSLAFSDAFTGALTRDSGEDVGNYAITQGTLALSSNYALTFVDGNLEITARAIEVTADDKSKVYGDSDPSLTYQITDGSLAFSDAFTGALTRDSGEDVGNYAITQGTLALSSNYALTFVDGNLEITARAIEVTADDKSKVYGDSDPSLTYQITDGSLAFSDAFTGALTRDSGEDVGNYAITQGTLALSSNYALTFVDGNLEITKKSASVTPDSNTKVYGNTDPSFSGTLSGFLIADNVSATYSRTSGETVAGSPYTISATLSPVEVLSNYDITYNTANFTITKRPITVTADNNSKYCGQVDPGLTYQVTSGNLAFTDAFTGNVARVSGEGTGVYSINQGSLVLNPNYDLTFISGQFTINGVSIDASASGTPVQIGTAATLRATVTPNVSGVSVRFEVTNELNVTVFDQIVTTNAAGLATVNTGNLTAIGVYKVTATVGSGCASSVAYIPVYDPNDSFVTGGGWINSPAGAMPANPTVVGKANFGFVSKYKKGSSQVDGNTEFQFNAGNINFKSTMHESGSLVISGGKATYRGTGTINGQPGYKFVVVAIDGNWNGGTNPDRFRIKITTATGGTVIYDNQFGKDENSNDATVLGNNGQGGGSIVIHEVKKGNKRVVADLIQVPWNTPIETVKKEIEKMSLTWFEAKKLPMTLQSDSYDPLTPGIYELKADLVANEFYSLDEPISIQVLVLNKPEALDIVVDNSKFASNLKSGEVLGYLNTIDPVDNIHSYSLDENPEVQLNGNKLIWTGTSVPASLSLRVLSTDRAGQTISREIKLSRELKPGEFFVYPNPASSETNVLIDLDNLSGTVAIQIYDAVGRVVGENVALREGRFTQTFNLDGLAAGMYTVQVRMGNMVMTKRLIIK
jgi:hypothetical protein